MEASKPEGDWSGRSGGDYRLKALISGQAAAAVILGRQPELRVLDAQPRTGVDASEFLRIFDGCRDVKEVSTETVEQVDKLVERAWASDRALKLFLFLLDPEEPRDELSEYAECVEELIADQIVRLSLEYRLLSSPLPNLVEIIGVEEACRRAPETLGVFREIISLQVQVQKVFDAFEGVPAIIFGGGAEKAAFRETLVDDGSFKDLVRSLAQNEDISFLKLKLVGSHRANSAAITQWTSSLQKGPMRRQRAQESKELIAEDWVDDWPEAEPHQNYQAFLQVRTQQTVIVEKLKSRDLVAARRLTRELIDTQKLNSTNDQIAKSLSALAQQAKRHEIPELQLEWSEWATEVNPLDPRTFGHFADALIGLGRLVDAESALDRVQQAGDPFYAATGRARILRVLGRPFEARGAYLAAMAEFADSPQIIFAWAGAAETLRDMGENEKALGEYRVITDRWPLETSGWAGLASVLMDMGRLDDAIMTFGKASAGDRIGLSKNGRATAYKLAGNFDAALRLYDEVVRDLPNNHVALCGRAEVLRAKGQFAAALDAYDRAIIRAPYAVVPITGKATILREMERFKEASVQYRIGIEKFPFDHRLATGLAAVLRGQGHYDQALAAFDEVLQKFPFDLQARISRAAVLHRLGAHEHALLVYDEILQDRPYASGAVSGKAAVLLSLKRYEEAAQLLPDVRPTSQVEWRRFGLRAFLVESTGGAGAAAKLLERGLESCPFAKETRSMRSALAALELRRNRPRDARRLVEAAPSGVSNVVALHVLAAAHRPGLARQRLEEIINGEGPAIVVELAREIARRHNLIDELPHETWSWINDVEREVLISEAA